VYRVKQMPIGRNPRSWVETTDAAVADPSQLLKWHSADRACITFSNLKMLQESQSALAAIVKEWATYHSALLNRNPTIKKNQTR
jgi:hypothetical protein